MSRYESSWELPANPSVNYPAGRPAVPRSLSAVPRLSVGALGMSLGLLLAISYVLCVLFDLWLPQWAMNPVWAKLLPGFSWLSWPSFFLGLAETFAYGWYAALVFGPLYNFFTARTLPRT